MIRLAKLFKEDSGVFQDTHDASAKTFTLCLLLILPLLITLLLLDLANDTVTALIYVMIGLDLVSLALVQRGLFRLSVPVMMIGLGLTATLAVFSLTTTWPYTVYMLCVFHLFIVFIAALVSYNKCYLYLSSAMAIASFALHYIFRELPAMETAGRNTTAIDDYITCTGLILISSVLIRNTLETRNRLFRRLEKTSREKAEKADQLASLYADLLRATDEKQDMAEKYRLLLETATDGIFIAQDGMIRFTNQKTLDILGYTEAELEVRPFAGLIHPDDRAMVTRRHQERLEGKNPPSAYTFRVITPGDRTIWLQIHTVVTLWDKRPATLNFIQDITGHKLMEQQIQQSQKMEAIGTLAGGIAHDFNNLLSGIYAYLQLAEKHVDQPERVTRDLAQIRTGADKAADLCRQILMISRKSEPVRQTVALAGIVREVLDLLKATLPASIRIEESIETQAVIHADPGKIHQVILNLCTNAFQAMAGQKQGILEICLRETTVYQDPDLNGKGIPPGPYLILSVRDTGEGMDLNTQARLFDPYFTTKAPGKGTGLGLAVALGIVEEHQGHIRVYSEKGRGSEFHVFLPRTAGRADARPAPTGTAEISCSQGHLLLVEDQEPLCEALRHLFEAHGYRVTCAGQGREALELFRENPGQYDLVLSDQVLPVMSGTELIRHVKALSPGTPAILCSGSMEFIAREKTEPADAFIPKPLDAALLINTVASLIGNGEADTGTPVPSPSVQTEL